MMTNQQLEIAIDQAQWLVRRLTEAHSLRWHGYYDKSDKAEKSALISLDDVADSMGFCLVTKEEALARADREREWRDGQVEADHPDQRPADRR